MHSIYKWFVGLYHENLYNYLAGFDCDLMPGGTNQFDGVIGIVTIAVVLLIACLYYFVRHARFNGILSWCAVLGIVALFSWGYGFGIVHSQESDIPACFMYGYDNYSGAAVESNEEAEYEDEEYYDETEETESEEVAEEEAKPVLTTQTYIGFGFANMFIGMIWFFLFSIIFKRFSPSCRHTPWPSIWPKH